MAELSRQKIVGMDVGGSKTRICVEDADTGRMLEDTRIDAYGWAGTSDADRARTLAEIARALKERHGRIDAIVAGVHGSDSTEQQEALAAPLRGICSLSRVMNDASLLVPACGLKSGTGVVAGTGSTATSTTSDGNALMVGGWGWVLGDEGGGAGLVREAARKVLDAYDCAEADPLATMLLDALTLSNPHALNHFLATTDTKHWAASAPVVFAALEAGSLRARAVIDEQARTLARMVALLHRRGGDTSVVVCAGGVIANQPMLLAAFEKALGAVLNIAPEVILLEEPPVTGALNLARALIKSPNILSRKGETA